MTYKELVDIIEFILDSSNVDNSDVRADEIASELKARGLYLDQEEL